jgi:excisionase family DNA binding protein
MARDSEYLYVWQVAQMLGVPIQSVRQWIREGRLPATRPGRRVLVRRRDIDALLRGSVIRPEGFRGWRDPTGVAVGHTR